MGKLLKRVSFCFVIGFMAVSAILYSLIAYSASRNSSYQRYGNMGVSLGGSAKATLDPMGASCQGAPTDCDSSPPLYARYISSGTWVRGRTLNNLACAGSFERRASDSRLGLVFSMSRNLGVVSSLFGGAVSPMLRVTQASTRDQGSQSYNLEKSFTPQWPFSGAWLEEEGVILIPDLPSKSIFHIALGEGVIRQVHAFSSVIEPSICS